MGKDIEAMMWETKISKRLNLKLKCYTLCRNKKYVQVLKNVTTPPIAFAKTKSVTLAKTKSVTLAKTTQPVQKAPVEVAPIRNDHVQKKEKIKVY